jgi:hypothetical protein
MLTHLLPCALSVLCTSQPPAPLQQAPLPGSAGPAAPGVHPSSIFAERQGRVQRSLVLIQPLLRPDQVQLPYEAVLRERERLMLFGATPAGQPLLGAALFAVTTVLVARAPAPLRPVFAGPVHLGPAVLEGGGLGAGAGARF